MKLFTESGATNLKLDDSKLSGLLLDGKSVVEPLLVGLDGWRIGVSLGITNIKLEIRLKNTLKKGTLPEINIEDSTATKLKLELESKQESEIIGLKFVEDSNYLGVVELKNHDSIYRLNVLGRFAPDVKFLNRNSLLSCELMDFGHGIELAPFDYVNISLDYFVALDGFNPNDTLKLTF